MYIERMTYEDATAKAVSIRDLGINEVYLEGGFPWNLVTRCEPGGSHRLEISTNVWFYAYDPKSELSFRWSLDIEPRSANGSDSYHIDTDNIRKVLSQLSGDVKIQFRHYLSDCANKVKNKGDEWMKIAMEQQFTSKILHELSSE